MLRGSVQPELLLCLGHHDVALYSHNLPVGSMSNFADNYRENEGRRGKTIE
jgi:hypothetical protein